MPGDLRGPRWPVIEHRVRWPRFDGTLTTDAMDSDTGLRGVIASANQPMPVGPDAAFSVVRVYTCQALTWDDQCTPTRMFDLPVGDPVITVRTQDGDVAPGEGIAVSRTPMVVSGSRRYSAAAGRLYEPPSRPVLCTHCLQRRRQ